MSDDIHQVFLSGGFFSCPKCSKYFRWVEEFAGKKVRCRCGHPIEFPLEPTGKKSWVLETTPEDAFSSTADDDAPVFKEAPKISIEASFSAAETAIELPDDEEVLELPSELEIELPPGVEIKIPEEFTLEDDPSVPLPDVESGDYDVDSQKLGRTDALHEGRCPECKKPLKPAAVLCLHCGYNLEAGKVLSTTT